MLMRILAVRMILMIVRILRRITLHLVTKFLIIWIFFEILMILES